MSSAIGLNMFHGTVGADKQCFVEIFFQISQTPLLTDLRKVSAIENRVQRYHLKTNRIWLLCLLFYGICGSNKLAGPLLYSAMAV
jgi:hypothetical protein